MPSLHTVSAHGHDRRPITGTDFIKSEAAHPCWTGQQEPDEWDPDLHGCSRICSSPQVDTNYPGDWPSGAAEQLFNRQPHIEIIKH